MAEKKSSVEDVLKSLKSDVEGSYKQASEQIQVVRSEVEGLQGTIRFQGWLTVIAIVVIGYTTSVTIKEKQFLHGEGLKKLLEHRETELVDSKVKPLIPGKKAIQKYAGELDRSDADVKKLAQGVAAEAVSKVPARRTDDEIKKIALANNRTDEQINALALKVAQAETKKVPARRTDAEIKKIALANNPTDKAIKGLALQVATAEVAKVPARRTDKEILKLAKSADWSEKEIISVAKKQAKAAVAKVPARRTDKEILALAKTGDVEIADQCAKSLQASMESTLNLAKSLDKLKKQLVDQIEKLKKQNADLAARIDTLGSAPATSNSDVEKCLRVLTKVRSKRVLKKLKLEKANLSKVDFSKAKMTDVDMKQANLSGVSFKGCLMENVNLDSADLSGADLRVEAFKNISLKGATYDSKTKFDAELLDLKALGAVKK